MLSNARTARLYWLWSRDPGPGLSTLEVPLDTCLEELHLDRAVPLGEALELRGQDLAPDYVVLEVAEGSGSAALAPGFYRLVERRSDEAMLRLMRKI